MSESEKKERYYFILQRLLNSTPGNPGLEEIKKHAKRLSELSSRHHFIPQYFVEGFCGSDGLLSVYNKAEDRISTRRIPPKSIFFEDGRHTIDLDGLKLSMIEDFLFKDIDNRLAPYLRQMRQKPIDDSLLTTDNQVNLSVFMIDLFWRNPRTDTVAQDLFQRAQLHWTDEINGLPLQDIEREAAYKSDPIYQKLARFGIQAQSMKHMTDDQEKGHTHSKFWEFKKAMFVLGDFPIVFSKFPETHAELATLDRFLPVCSTRIYAEQELIGTSFLKKDALIMNILQIMQAKKFVVAADENLLRQSVSTYKAMKEDESLFAAKKYLFSRIR